MRRSSKKDLQDQSQTVSLTSATRRPLITRVDHPKDQTYTTSPPRPRGPYVPNDRSFVEYDSEPTTDTTSAAETPSPAPLRLARSPPQPPPRRYNIPLHSRHESHEIHLSQSHVTRDSMVESMLSSFDQLAPPSTRQPLDPEEYQALKAAFSADGSTTRDYRNLLDRTLKHPVPSTPKDRVDFHSDNPAPNQSPAKSFSTPPQADAVATAFEKSAIQKETSALTMAPSSPTAKDPPNVQKTFEALNFVSSNNSSASGTPTKKNKPSQPRQPATQPNLLANGRSIPRREGSIPSVDRLNEGSPVASASSIRREATTSNVLSSSPPSAWSTGQGARSSILSAALNSHPPLRSSKSMVVGGSSMLDRARPVPSDYHDFSGELPGDPDSRRALARDYSTASFFSDTPGTPTGRAFGGPLHSSSLVNLASTNPDFRQENVRADQQSGQDAHAVGATDRAADAVSTASPARNSPRASGSAPSGRSKPGFFKKIFGGGSSKSSAPSEPPQLPLLDVQSRQSAKGNQTSAVTANIQTDDVPIALMQKDSIPKPPPIPPEENDLDNKAIPAQSLNKKSSFFRRRKKTIATQESAADSDGLPRQDSQSNVNQTSVLPRPSMSSLRKVMVPFLSDSDNQKQGHSAKGSVATTASPGFLDKRRSRTKSLSRVVTGSIDMSMRAAEPHPRPSTSARPTKQSLDLDLPAMPGSFEPNVRSLQSSGSTKTMQTMPSRGSNKTGPPRSDSREENDRIGPTDRPIAKAEAVTVGTQSKFFEGLPESKGSMSSSVAQKRLASPKSDGADSIDVISSPISPGDDEFQSATSLPLVQVDGETVVTENSTDIDQPSAAEQEHARRIFDQQDENITADKAAAYLGEATSEAQRLRIAYFQNYDFAGLNVLLGMRDLCGRLVLRGETQQVDRLLDAFSTRWCQCNPNHGFKSPDAIHAICYSLLLLNTDLHMADVESKMTRPQFIKNTMPLIRSMAGDSLAESNTNSKSNLFSKRGSTAPRDVRSPTPVGAHADSDSTRPSIDGLRVESRAVNRPMSQAISVSSPTPYDTRSNDNSSLLVNAPIEGSAKAWESTVESILRDFYNSIRNDRLPLHGTTVPQLHEQASNNSLTVSSLLKRSGSVASKNPSESGRGRPAELRSVTSRWASKNRSRQALYPSSTMNSSRTASRTSLEAPSMWTPGASSTWSKSYPSNALSTDSLASRLTRGGDDRYQQSIGFANALSHAIIREEGNASGSEEEQPDELPAFAELGLLGLAGAPWVKEGILQHKHHLETTDKKAKDRNWAECFAVIEKGTMRLFSFNSKASQKSSKLKPSKGAVVGGGNWMDSAEPVGTFTLRQTIANALPPPGYSKARPHVFALSLPTGAVHLFHVGTPEIAREFVSTANYWSARLSKEPLTGGVSNVEYGWSENLLSSAATATPSREDLPGSTESAAPHHHRTRGSVSTVAPTPRGHSQRPSTSTSILEARPSISGSIRSTMTEKRPADRVALAEWSPPTQSLMASALPEGEQLAALRAYVAAVEADLATHNELRPAMALAYGPRSANAARAAANWERKSSYLLREIVKYGTYVESLEAGSKEGDRVRKEAEEREREKEEREREKAKARQSEDGVLGRALEAEVVAAVRLANSRENVADVDAE